MIFTKNEVILASFFIDSFEISHCIINRKLPQLHTILLLNAYKLHYTEICFIFATFMPMSRPRSIYVVSM